MASISNPIDTSDSKQQQKSINNETNNKNNTNTEQCGPKTIETLTFDNKAIHNLPIDQERKNYIRECVPNAIFSLVKPEPVDKPELVSVSLDALKLIDLDEKQAQRPDFIEYFSGNKSIPGAEYAAHCYCGHQFGSFSGQLGDGAAMYIGEIINCKGDRIELQFKGSGPTPYSRRADGRKVLRSSIREFLCSEHMHALGIPTTRAATIVTSNSKVQRDMFYTGNVIEEKCTIITRLAPTFFRFGSFEIAKPTDDYTGRTGPSVNNPDIVKQLLDYTIENYYPEIWKQAHDDLESMYLAFFKEITKRTALLVAKWQSVGWAHGVLNTDNMSIVGLSLDFGPFGFLDAYDPSFVPNTSDDQGRYSYENQPEICQWNCMKLAEAIQKYLPKSKSNPIHTEYYQEVYQTEYRRIFRNKLGLIFADEGKSDDDLIEEWLETMEITGSDFTNTFRYLADINVDIDNTNTEQKDIVDKDLDYLISISSPLSAVIRSLAPRIHPQQLQMLLMMLQTQPQLMQQMGEQASFIENELNKAKLRQKLQSMTPEEKKAKDKQTWAKMLIKYRARLQLEIQTAQKQNKSKEQAIQERITIQNKTNPKFVLRNYMAQIAITAADKGDYSEVNRLLLLLSDPYQQNEEIQSKLKKLDEELGDMMSKPVDGERSTCVRYSQLPPEWAGTCKVSCSS